MKMPELAKKGGKSGVYELTLQKKFGLPAYKDYSGGHDVLVEKLIYPSICSVSDKDVKSLLAKERKLRELLRVDSLHDGELWFDAKRGFPQESTGVWFFTSSISVGIP